MIKSRKVELAVIRVQYLEKADLKECAFEFLSIYNNVRENKDVFLKFEMTYDSELIFVVQKEDVKKVVDWLKENFYPVWDMDTLKIENEVRTIIQDWDDDFNEDVLLTDRIDIEEI